MLCRIHFLSECTESLFLCRKEGRREIYSDLSEGAGKFAMEEDVVRYTVLVLEATYYFKVRTSVCCSRKKGKERIF